MVESNHRIFDTPGLNLYLVVNMTMKKQLLLCFISTLVQASLLGQSRHAEQFTELGFGLATTNYSGDIAEPHIVLPQTRIGGQVFVRHQLHPFILVRGQLFAGLLAGDDKHSTVHAGRNFKFSTRFLELSGLLELALGTYQYDPVFSQQSLFILPYLFAGVGATVLRSKVTYYGPESRRAYFIRTPIPEGGADQQTLLVTPVGLGLRVILRQQLAFGLEASARPGYSDLLDGVSQNGNPNEGDWYYSIGLTASYYLNGPWRRAKGGN